MAHAWHRPGELWRVPVKCGKPRNKWLEVLDDAKYFFGLAGAHIMKNVKRYDQK